ncbi:MAG TPA: hypothetical protein VFQ61_00470 [Polyangiaceae bacterium]|nr:hypothetical protein [Polyangiaceae bacterium]
MLISEHTLRPADIIVSTTDASISAVIRAGTGSSVSHSMIYLGGSFVIEAIAEGVVRRPLAVALEQAALAIALRRRNLTDQQRRAVIDYATGFMFRPYDEIGAAGAATSLGRGSLLAAFGCGISLGLCALGVVGMANNAKPANADRAFFCSELVARVFELAGAPVVSGPPSYTTPRQIRTADTLLYLGKLVDESPRVGARLGPARGAEGARAF